jgi:hypothetical protein
MGSLLSGSLAWRVGLSKGRLWGDITLFYCGFSLYSRYPADRAFWLATSLNRLVHKSTHCSLRKTNCPSEAHQINNHVQQDLNSPIRKARHVLPDFGAPMRLCGATQNFGAEIGSRSPEPAAHRHAQTLSPIASEARAMVQRPRLRDG